MHVIGTDQIAQTTPRADAISRFVRAAYGRGDIEECSLFRCAFNLMYGLRFKNGSRAVARLSAARPRGLPNIEYEAALLDHLKMRGVLVAAPLRTREGAASIELRLPEGVRHMMLFEHLTGDTPGSSLENVYATGRSLAELHHAASSFQGPQSLYVLDLPLLLDAPLERLLKAPSLPAEVGQRFEAIARQLRDHFQDCELERVRCHGDCHGANNFMVESGDGKRRAAFFDFDDTGPGLLAYELGVFLWANVPHKVGVVDDEAWKKWHAYMSGYLSVRHVSAADIAAIPFFMAVRQFWLMGEYAGRLDTWGTQALMPGWLRLQPALLESWMALDLKKPRL